MPHMQVFKPNHLEQADLLFMPTGAFGYKYILVIVDAHSKKCDLVQKCDFFLII